MARQVDIINYLPPILKEYKELISIAAAENPEINLLWTTLENVMNDQFVDKLTDNGAKRWEKILTIVPKGTDTLDFRRFRIKTRLNEKLPYTYRVLEQQLITLCGEDGYSLELQNNEYTLKVRIDLIAKSKFNDVNDLLSRIVPANIVIDLSLLYNSYFTLAQFTHAQLSAYTHDQLRNEVLT